MEDKKHLNRTIGLWGLSANIVNTVVGAGIFALPAIIAAGLGSSGVFAYLICGILIALVMLCFTEVGSKVVKSGGPYTYIETAFGPYFGFLTVILFGLATVSADAAVANAVADVITGVVPWFHGKAMRIAFFIIVFGGLAYINVRGVKEGINLVKLITVSKLIPLLVLAFVGWNQVEFANLAITSTPTIQELGQTSLILFFAFQGAESGLCVSGEVSNPQKTIPRAILISTLGVLILYIIIQTVSQGIAGPALADFNQNPLGQVASLAFGPVGFALMTIGAAISMFGNLSSEILSVPRVFFQASKDGVLPFAVLGRVHSKFTTPYVSVIIYSSIGFLFASAGGFEQLAVISSASALLVYLGVVLAVIALRRKGSSEQEQEGYRIPGGHTIPILSALVICYFLAGLSMNEFIGIGIAIAVLSLIYLLNRRLKP